MSEVCLTVMIKSTHPESQGAFVEINASAFDPAKHERYIAPPPAAPSPVLPPPPPGPVDPLASLPKDWRDKDVSELRALAQSATGRMPDNKRQAVEMIQAALVARK